MATYLESTSGIYKIINTVNNKIYVGCASNIRTRINGHLYDLRKNIHKNDYLQKSYNKYGEDVFKFTILEKCKIQDLHKKEDMWVNKLKCLNKNIGYNLKPTDPNGCSIHSEETKHKLHLANKGKKPSFQCLEQARLYFLTDAGKEHVKKAREKLKNVNFYDVNAHKRKKVMDTSNGKIYESLALAAKEYNVPKARLSKYLNGVRTNKTNLKYL